MPTPCCGCWSWGLPCHGAPPSARCTRSPTSCASRKPREPCLPGWRWAACCWGRSRVSWPGSGGATWSRKPRDRSGRDSCSSWRRAEASSSRCCRFSWPSRCFCSTMPHLKYATAPGLLLFASAAVAHVPGDIQEDRSTLWLSAMLTVSLGLYAFGLLRLWPHVHARGDLWRRAAAFVAGWLTLVIALLSSIDRRSASSFAWHMAQHELLMLVAAPLLVWGRALPTFLWSLPHDARVRIGLATKAR